MIIYILIKSLNSLSVFLLTKMKIKTWLVCCDAYHRSQKQNKLGLKGKPSFPTSLIPIKASRALNIDKNIHWKELVLPHSNGN